MKAWPPTPHASPTDFVLTAEYTCRSQKVRADLRGSQGHYRGGLWILSSRPHAGLCVLWGIRVLRWYVHGDLCCLAGGLLSFVSVFFRLFAFLTRYKSVDIQDRMKHKHQPNYKPYPGRASVLPGRPALFGLCRNYYLLTPQGKFRILSVYNVIHKFNIQNCPQLLTCV